MRRHCPMNNIGIYLRWILCLWILQCQYCKLIGREFKKIYLCIYKYIYTIINKKIMYCTYVIKKANHA